MILLRTLDSKQIRAANRLLDALDRSERRDTGHMNRWTERHHCRIVVSITVQTESGDQSGSLMFLKGLVRNISSTGLSFVQSAGLDQGKITIDFGNALNRRLRARILRCRSIQGRICEYGTVFETPLSVEELNSVREPASR